MPTSRSAVLFDKHQFVTHCATMCYKFSRAQNICAPGDSRIGHFFKSVNPVAGIHAEAQKGERG